MRNFYFIAVLGLLLVGCSPENDELSQYNNQTLSADVTTCTISAGEDKSVTLTNDYVKGNLNDLTLLKNYYLSLLDEGVSKNGTFQPTITTLGSSYRRNNLNTFSTTYSVNEGECTDSTNLSITVVEKIEDSECSAGVDRFVTLDNNFVQNNLNGIELLKEFYLSLLEEGVPHNGKFEPTITTLGNSYQRNNYNTFTTIYTIQNGDCEDSVQLSIKIIPPCSAGEDKFETLTNDYVKKNLYTPARLRRYFRSLLDENVSKEGAFNPTMRTLIDSYQENNFQTFTTTYTIIDGNCSDSTQLSIEVVQ